LSLSSHTSGTPLSIENEDIVPRVSVDEHGSAQAAAAASSRMVCPICNEEMVMTFVPHRAGKYHVTDGSR